MLEVFEYAQEDYSHVLVHAVNYVRSVFFGSENHAASHMRFKLVQLAEISVGAVKYISDKRFRFFSAFHIFDEPFGDDNARYVRSDFHEMAVAIEAMVFLFDARIPCFHIKVGVSHRHHIFGSFRQLTFDQFLHVNLEGSHRILKLPRFQHFGVNLTQKSNVHAVNRGGANSSLNKA